MEKQAVVIVFDSDNKVTVVIQLSPEDIANASSNIHEVISGLMESSATNEKARSGVIFLLWLLDQMQLSESQIVKAAKALCEEA